MIARRLILAVTLFAGETRVGNFIDQADGAGGEGRWLERCDDESDSARRQDHHLRGQSAYVLGRFHRSIFGSTVALLRGRMRQLRHCAAKNIRFLRSSVDVEILGIFKQKNDN